MAMKEGARIHNDLQTLLRRSKSFYQFSERFFTFVSTRHTMACQHQSLKSILWVITCKSLA